MPSHQRLSWRLISLLFLFGMIAAIPTFAAPTIAGSSRSANRLTGGAGNVATFPSFTHTTPAGNQRLLLISVAMNVNNNAGAQVNTVSYNGTALTKVVGTTSAARRV